MSFQAMAWAVQQRTGSPTAKLLLLILCNYADNDGVCWPSQQTLAEDTEMTDRTIRTALGILVERSLVSVEHRPGTGGGRKTNVYRISLPERISESRVGNRKNLQGQPEAKQGQPEKSSDDTIIEPINEPVIGKERKRSTTIPEGFPSELDIRWTLKECPSLKAWDEAARFRDYSTQHRKLYADWPAAWRNWCRNAVKWAGEKRFA